jgi:hypothetical protein
MTPKKPAPTPALFRLDAGVLDHLGPFHELGLIALWLSTTPSRWPMMRPIRSLPLPGPNGTTKLIGLLG